MSFSRNAYPIRNINLLQIVLEIAFYLSELLKGIARIKISLLFSSFAGLLLHKYIGTMIILVIYNNIQLLIISTRESGRSAYTVLVIKKRLYIKECMVVTISLGGIVADQMRYNLVSVQYL